MNNSGQESDDPADLERFVIAQNGIYENVLVELRQGAKRSHWMWFVFPQIAGLGRSPTARLYAVVGSDEARAYLSHPILGPRLRECTEIVLRLEGRSAEKVFGFPDNMKLKSCMTLFASISEPDNVFKRVLDKYFSGEPDSGTLQLLAGG